MSRRLSFPLLAALCLGVFCPGTGHAQAISGTEIERGLRRDGGANVPYDAAPFSHRYGFEAGPALYFNLNPNCLYYLDYLDRLDRAERFGYRLPAPPPYVCPARPFRLVR